jgi:hypothetical protein
LREVVTPEVESIFYEAVGAEGFTLYDLAVLASAVEHGVHEQQQ